MFRIAQIILLLGLLLGSCSPQEQTIAPIPESSPIPTVTPQPTHTLTPEPSPTATPLSIPDRVRAFMVGNIDFPSDLTREQYSAFIKEMNTQRGAKPIYVELDGKTMYLSKETRIMEPIPGSYLENKALIDQNSFPLYAEVYQEEGQDLQYVHPDTGELMTLPKSADVDWTHVVNAENFSDGYMQLTPGEIEDWMAEFLKDYDVEFYQAILLDQEPIKLARRQGTFDDWDTLNTLFLRTDKQGKPLYAVRVFYGTIGLSHGVGEENNPDFEYVDYYRIDPDQYSKELDQLRGNSLYFVDIEKDQTMVWEDMARSTIDELKNLVSTDQASEAGVNDLTPDGGNVAIAGGFLILKK